MSMISEIEKFMSNEINTSTNYRIINIGGNFLYIEGIKSVVSFGEDEMLFDIKKKGLKVQGSALKIKYLDKTTVVIEGNVISVGVV